MSAVCLLYKSSINLEGVSPLWLGNREKESNTEQSLRISVIPGHLKLRALGWEVDSRGVGGNREREREGETDREQSPGYRLLAVWRVDGARHAGQARFQAQTSFSRVGRKVHNPQHIDR